ncbi:MAG: DNA mismatch repair protein MutS [Bdellovibrionaceae bacterium]|nr:DNA mismatch repair protein MutS [Pseudobdellovibrionaceae bacterium]MDW8190157.1 DNA mismatch repair protein MutS [Pseudobdellovibrionaceae bacterium]
MQQYWEIKKEHPDKILFYRMGDFFELFYDDAVTVAPLLGLTLTQRNKKTADDTPMCGVPHHAIAGPINKLLQHGFKVAICDQLEDPKLAKGIVKRGVTRILTPGMVYDPETIDNTQHHYMACYHNGELACVDTTTGEAFYFKNVTRDQIVAFMSHHFIAEWVVADVDLAEGIGLVNYSFFDLTKVTQSPELHSFSAREVLLSYIRSLVTDGQSITLKEFKRRHFQHYLKLNPQIFKHLEIFESYHADQRNSLFGVLNKTFTPMGARKLREWLTYPSVNYDLLSARRRNIEDIVLHWDKIVLLVDRFKSIGDVERRLFRVQQPQSNARDMMQLMSSLKWGLSLIQDWPYSLMDKKCETEALTQGELSLLNTLIKKMETTIVDDPPLSVTQGFIIRSGVDPVLDELIELSSHGQNHIIKLEEKERLQTHIPSLKIRYNSVFGYYIEVTNTHKDKVPAHYIRKQTLTQAERYTTEELIQLERKILEAHSQRFQLEHQIFLKLKEDVLSNSKVILKLAELIAYLDVCCNGARLIVEEDYHYIQIVDEDQISIRHSRHPVVEKTVQRFVSNDVCLSVGQIMLLTGPNMAGKSTLMRQVALCLWLTHIGYPASCAGGAAPLIDGIFTRIGASDSLSEGMSTFMVEMRETSYILNHYGRKSLIILDEIGRGTSTFDGLSLAQGILEHLIDKAQGFTIFATHYHELSEMEMRYPGILMNFHMTILEKQGQLEFLHSLKKGAAGKSYGLYVAELAGIPMSILKRAKHHLKTLENSQKTKIQLELFQTSSGMEPLLACQDSVSVDLSSKEKWEDIIDQIRNLNLNQTTPVEALIFLDGLQKKIRVQAQDKVLDPISGLPKEGEKVIQPVLDQFDI